MADPATDPPFRVLLCTAADAAARVEWPGVDVRHVTAAALSAGPWPTAGGPPWRTFACRLALEAGFDAVVMVESPDADPAAIVGPLRDGTAEVVRRRPPTRGLSARLSRRLIGRPPGPATACGYAARLLRRVPFELNADGPLFHLQLLLQAAHVGATIADVDGPPTPPPAGRLPGGLPTAVQFRLHQMGMLCALRYRNLTPFRYRDKTFMEYTSHALALRLVRAAAPRTLLDVGCGPGFIAARCRADGVRVTGLDAHDPLPDTVDAFHRVDLERDPLPVDPFAFDCVLMLDVLEHLADPESFLIGLRNRSEATPPPGAEARVILSTPNVAFAAVRLNLLLGRFTYAERGILDVTHKRLFTRRSLLTMLRDCGYDVERTTAVGPPFQTVWAGRGGAVLGAITDALARVWPSAFAFQLIVVARPRPGVRQLLRARPALLAAVGRA